MLFVIYKDNHPSLSYHGGQGPIVHLEADLNDVVTWADDAGVRWAFSLSNAGAAYTEYRRSVDHLDQLDWPAIASTDFRAPEIKEGKQAEFLLREFFPWQLVERIGVRSVAIQDQVLHTLGAVAPAPTVEIRQDWYY